MDQRRQIDLPRRIPTCRVKRPPAFRLCASEVDRQKEEGTIYSFLKQPEDYEETVVYARSKFRYRNSLISLAIAISIVTLSILVFLTTYTILTYIRLHYPQPHKNHPFLHVTPAHSKAYNDYLRKLKFLVETATHPKGSQPKLHHFEFKLSEGTIAYRISNNSYQSQQLWKDDYELFQDNSAKFGIIYCDNWEKNTNWRPLRYDCVPNLKVAVPLDMLDQTPSSNSGINFLLNDEVSHPTLLAAAAIMTALFFLLCTILCCCQLSTCGGTAIALQRTKKSKKNYDHRSFDPTLNAMLANATAPQPRAGHV